MLTSYLAIVDTLRAFTLLWHVLEIECSIYSTNTILNFSAWLRNDESPVVARLSHLIEAVTNLNMKTAEDLQVGCNNNETYGNFLFIIRSQTTVLAVTMSRTLISHE